MHRSIHRQRVLPLAAIASAALALSACAGSDQGSGYTTSPAPISVSTSAPSGHHDHGSDSPAARSSAMATPAADGVRLTVHEVANLGTVVTDGAGHTLYRFDEDNSKPSTATCIDDCAATWPPVIVNPEGKLSLKGVQQSAVAMVQRPDGASQLTIGGFPVYRFSGDQAAGAVGGQGVDGAWFAITPEGGKAG